MCVDLSARQVREPGLAEAVEWVLEETGFSPDRLFLKIIESAAMEDAPTTALVL